MGFVFGEIPKNYFRIDPTYYPPDGFAIGAFIDAGWGLYNDAILLNAAGSACIRARNSFKNKKLVKIHQNVLMFKKEG